MKYFFGDKETGRLSVKPQRPSGNLTGKASTSATVTLDDILSHLNISSDDYHKALSISIKGRSLVLQRRPCDVNINNYNSTVLLAWQANIDLQPVLDPYACIMYIVSYITKDEREMGEVLRAAKKEHSDKDIRTQLKKIGSVFLTHRELSAQEAVFRLLGLTMLSCSVKRVFVPTDLPENRVRILKAAKNLEHLDPDSDDVYMIGLIQRYACRPAALDAMCLADFAVEYDVCYSRKKTCDNDDICVESTEDGQTYDRLIELQNEMGTMRHRKIRAILLTHRFSTDKEPDKYYHAELMLFTPWRQEESDLLAGFASYSDAYRAKGDEVIAAKKKFQHYAEDVSEAIDHFFESGSPQTAWDLLAAQERQQNAIAAEEGTAPETFIDCADDAIFNESFIDRPDMHSPLLVSVEPSRLLPDDTYYKLLQSLNAGQQHLFQYVLDWCRRKRLCDSIAPFHVFCTGGAGVGKSHLIRAVVEMANRELRKPGKNPDDILIHLSAPTGTAAYGINGSTIHSSFLLSASNGTRSNTLSAEKLATLRNKFGNLKILIIDEISMVGANLLVALHERLSAIAGLMTSLPFAGVSILAMGDFQQLAPVRESPVYKAPKAGLYALAELWSSNFNVLELTEIMRQKGDSTFAELLSRLRIGTLTVDDIKCLQSRQVLPTDVHIALCPRVFALNADVDAYNKERLESLLSPLITVYAKDRFPNKCKNPANVADDNRSGLSSVLQLKANARVMLVRNVATELGLFNGALGTVTGFLPVGSNPTTVLVLFDDSKLQDVAISRYPHFKKSYPIERFEARFPTTQRRGNKYIEATRLQFPLKLAFAMTIHKCQGQTLNEVVVSLKGYFGAGQAYVAISRCRTLAGLYITDLDIKCVKVNRNGLRALEEMKAERSLAVPHAAWLKESNSVRIAVLNTRSLKKHADSIISSCYMSACDIAVFTESRLSDSCMPHPFGQYTTFLANGTADHNFVGGVAISVMSRVTGTELMTVSESHFQQMALQVNCTFQESFGLVGIYRSPNLSLSAFRSKLHEHVTPLIDKYRERLIIVGDFNIDGRYSTLFDIPQLVTAATHVDGSIIDHVYWTGNNSSIATDVIACHWSDHNIVAISLSASDHTMPDISPHNQPSDKTQQQQLLQLQHR